MCDLGAPTSRSACEDCYWHPARARRLSGSPRWSAIDPRVADRCREWGARFAPYLADHRMLHATGSPGPEHPVRGRAGERCSTSTTAPIPSSPARAPWPAAPPPARGAADRDRRRPGPAQGLHHAGRRRPASHRAHRRRRRVPAQARQRVRHHHRPAAPLRLARPGRGALRPRPQRRRRHRADQARRPRRPAGDPPLHRLPHRRPRGDRFPASRTDLAAAEPVYRTVPGWKTNTAGKLAWEDLPQTARDYVRTIEDELDAPVVIVSTGPRREETILRGGGGEACRGAPCRQCSRCRRFSGTFKFDRAGRPARLRPDLRRRLR
jgi:hypothetical protein